MSFAGFFSSQVETLDRFKLGKLSEDSGILKLRIQGRKGSSRRMYEYGVDDLLQIRHKIKVHLAQIQYAGAKEEIRGQLGKLKGKMIEQINRDRGWFRGMGKEERAFLDTYFDELSASIDQSPHSLRYLATAGLQLGGVGALAYGAYLYYAKTV